MNSFTVSSILAATDLSESRHWKLEGETLELYTDPGRTIRFARVQ